MNTNAPYRAPLAVSEYRLRSPRGHVYGPLLILAISLVWGIGLALIGAWILAALVAVPMLASSLVLLHIGAAGYRGSPVAVRVTRTSIELDYRDGRMLSIAVQDLRFDLSAEAISVGRVDGGEGQGIELEAFPSSSDAAAFLKAASELLGYDVTDPVGELSRLRAAQRALRAAPTDDDEGDHRGDDEEDDEDVKTNAPPHESEAG